MFDPDTTDSPDTDLAQSNLQDIGPPECDGYAEEAISRCETGEVPPAVYKGIKLDPMKYKLVGPPVMRSRELGPSAYAASKSTFPKKSICVPKPSSPARALPNGEKPRGKYPPRQERNAARKLGRAKDKDCKDAWRLW